MKKFCLVMFVATVVFVSSCSPLDQQAATATGRAGSVAVGPEDVERVLAQAEREKAVDMASGRWTERWIADDLVITGADGIVLSNAKAQSLENIRSGAWKVEAVSVDNIEVRVFGEAAVVTAIQTEKSQFRGADSGGRFQYTHLWVKRGGQWQVVAAHVTRLK
jgi:hypothetical protein